MIRMLDSAGSTLVEWGRQQQQHVDGSPWTLLYDYFLKEKVLADLEVLLGKDITIVGRFRF